ncbi:MAG: DUF6502 family protein [Pseudomonadota bacterium]
MAEDDDMRRGVQGGGGAPDVSAETAEAFKRLLRPLATAMIQQGIPAPAAYRLLKEAFVEAAEQDFTLDGTRATDSRVSLLTGVHRKDVKDIRTRSEPEPAALGGTLLATVIGRWLGDRANTDAEGTALPLPRSAETGPSFDALVAGVNKDVRPRTVLDELVFQNLVRIDEDTDTVHLLADAFIGRRDRAHLFHFFERNLADHAAAAAANLLRSDDGAPFLERAVFYNNLNPTSVDMLEEMARNASDAVLQELNRAALTHQTNDTDASQTETAHSGDTARERFRFGVYFYRERLDDADMGQKDQDAATPEGEPAPDGTDK